MPHLLFGGLAAAAVALIPPSPDPVLGIWTNPKHTLAVRTKPCGDGLCGVIVWAAPKALADAREAGVAGLVGTELLQDYHRSGRGSWSGRVFVPDMGRSFSSRLRQSAPDQLTISGCLVAGFFCKSQDWRRVP